MTDRRPVGEGAAFVDDLLRAFAEQKISSDGQGAVVRDARLISQGAHDLAIEVVYEDLLTGVQATDRVNDVKAYMAGCGAESPNELAAFWIQELDERLLSAD